MLLLLYSNFSLHSVGCAWKSCPALTLKRLPTPDLGTYIRTPSLPASLKKKYGPLRVVVLEFQWQGAVRILAGGTKTVDKIISKLYFSLILFCCKLLYYFRPQALYILSFRQTFCLLMELKQYFVWLWCCYRPMRKLSWHVTPLNRLWTTWRPPFPPSTLTKLEALFHK